MNSPKIQNKGDFKGHKSLQDCLTFAPELVKIINIEYR